MARDGLVERPMSVQDLAQDFERHPPGIGHGRPQAGKVAALGAPARRRVLAHPQGLRC